jgi:hypothetical protein
MQRVCPNPKRWHELSQQLARYADSHHCTPARPPTPLILAGWAFSNDIEKRQRWQETVDWAATNGCSTLIDAIADEDYYELGDPSGGPRASAQ